MSTRLRKYTEHKVYGLTILELRIRDDDRIGDGIILSRAVPDPWLRLRRGESACSLSAGALQGRERTRAKRDDPRYRPKKWTIIVGSAKKGAMR